MKDEKIKQLEFIQNVIIRMAQNSFLLKGWSVTLVSAIFALAAKESNQNYVLISFIPVVMFWILDGYFLSKERQYRDLYKQACLNPDITDFSMDISHQIREENSWPASFASVTLKIFHGTLFVVVLIAMFIIPLISKCK